jgi:glycosyltransferase involved in cell wall biosynthesis
MKILIIGKLPPPIGGVTIHVNRLIEHLSLLHYSFSFRRLKVSTVVVLPFILGRIRKIHLHSSNPYIRLYVALLSKCFCVKSIITFHGNIGRYNFFLNLIDRLVIKLSTCPIVLNENSFKIASVINKRTKLVSAFIPPIGIEPLYNKDLDQIKQLRKTVSKLFCTNAYNVTIDKQRNEIYQISEIVNLFRKHKDIGLVVSDPSGAYFKKLEKLIDEYDNIYFIPYPHDFNAVIRECDFMLRYTTTDGDALSVKEALQLKKTVIATNVVSRPKDIILVNLDIIELERLIVEVEPIDIDHISFYEDTIRELIEIYKQF